MKFMTKLRTVEQIWEESDSKLSWNEWTLWCIECRDIAKDKILKLLMKRPFNEEELHYINSDTFLNWLFLNHLKKKMKSIWIPFPVKIVRHYKDKDFNLYMTNLQTKFEYFYDLMTKKVQDYRTIANLETGWVNQDKKFLLQVLNENQIDFIEVFTKVANTLAIIHSSWIVLWEKEYWWEFTSHPALSIFSIWVNPIKTSKTWKKYDLYLIDLHNLKSNSDERNLELYVKDLNSLLNDIREYYWLLPQNLLNEYSQTLKSLNPNLHARLSNRIFIYWI